MRRPAVASSGLPPPAAVPVTAWLCGIIVGVTVLAAVAGRNGVAIDKLQYDVVEILDLEVWRLFTYPFIVGSSGALIISVIILYMFGASCEMRWGSRDFLRFFLVSAVGAGILAVPLSFIVNLLFTEIGLAQGPNAAINAMLVATAVANPDANILYMFVLPIRARTIVLIMLAYYFIDGIVSGAAALSVNLAGMLMGYLLVTGNWRPTRLISRLKLLTLRTRRGGLYVVPPKNRTLH